MACYILPIFGKKFLTLESRQGGLPRCTSYSTANLFFGFRMENKAAWLQCKHLIETGASLDEVKESLASLARSDIVSSYQDDVNLLHTAIIANHIEAARFLLIQGLYLPPHESKTFPYLHTACRYGHTVIAGLIIDERRQDLWQTMPADSEYLRKLFSRCSDNTHDTQDKEAKVNLPKLGSYRMTALDVAAAFKHTRCVELLLQHSQPAESLLASAVENNAPQALALILSSSRYTPDQMNKAFKLSLIRRYSDCMDLLLQNGATPAAVLNGMNPYHVMFMYSQPARPSCDLFKWTSLEDCVLVLVKHGYDVNAAQPTASYPLYSLLHCMVMDNDFHISRHPDQHYYCLAALMKAGADPNFDEMKTFDQNTTDSPSSFGRELHTSALSSLFTAFQQSDVWAYKNPVDYINRCCKLILEHGGNPSYCDGLGETPAHDLMSCLAMHQASGNFSLHLAKVLATLFSYGADPAQKSVDRSNPILQYMMVLFTCATAVGTQDSFDPYKPCIEEILHFLDYMSPKEASITAQAILESIDRIGDIDIDQTSRLCVKTLLDKHIKKVHRLQHYCNLVIWQAMGRKLGASKQLPLPPFLQNSLMCMFGYNCFDL